MRILKILNRDDCYDYNEGIPTSILLPVILSYIELTDSHTVYLDFLPLIGHRGLHTYFSVMLCEVTSRILRAISAAVILSFFSLFFCDRLVGVRAMDRVSYSHIHILYIHIYVDRVCAGVGTLPALYS